jgi:chromosomal replication initiator protein
MESIESQQWEKCLKKIQDNLPSDQFKAWFQPIIPKSFENGRLTLTVPSPYFVEHLEEHYAHLIGVTIRSVYGQAVQLFYHYNQIKNEPSTGIEIRSTNPSNAVKNGLPMANPLVTPAKVQFDSQLNPRYTFENYCGSMSNKIAVSIGKAIADDPDNKTFNPLFIFGPSGVGKTHLMHAIGLSIKERRPQLRVLYVSSRLFESQYTVASRNGKINDFIYFYQSIDVLIIDDIQDLIDKEKTQNTFFHIFSHLHLNNKQIIISSDCSPSQLKGMPERLLTRMKWGMIVELERPDVELRREVIVQKAEQEGLSIPSEVLDYIAVNVTDSIRELEGTVATLIARATILGKEITVDLARNVVANAVKVVKKQINFEMVTQSVASYYNVEPDAIFTKSRKREISDARQMVMYLAKKHAKMPLKAIGTRLSRTHATVLYACKNIEERIPFEKQLQEDITSIEKNFLS